MGINNSLLKSIQTIVNKAINIAPFDKTRQAQIITNNGDGTYTIRLDGILYNNIPSYPIFNGLIVGTIVKVVIPSNQTSQMYVQPSKGGGGGEHRELTQAEYDALSPSEKHNDTVYFITDSQPNTVVINDSVPIGAIQSYGAQVAPYGWHICDGSAVRRDAYPELFAVIGTTYGEGDGSTTFNLPDLQDRVPIGAGNSYLLNDYGGATSHYHTTGNVTLDINQVPSHNHNINTWFDLRGVDYANGTPFPNVGSGLSVSSTSQSLDGFTQANTKVNPRRLTINKDTNSKGGGSAHNHGNTGDSSNMMPYRGVNFIIKVKEPAIVTASTAPSVHDFIDIFYPVGSYYESSDTSFDPNADWGGTWILTDGGIMNANPNSYSWERAMNSSTITTTSSALINGTTYTTNTGKFIIMVDAGLFTSRYTSNISVLVDNSWTCSAVTNQTTVHNLKASTVVTSTKGQTHDIQFRVNSQDSGTTATIASYTNTHFVIVDIPQIEGMIWHRIA